MLRGARRLARVSLVLAFIVLLAGCGEKDDAAPQGATADATGEAGPEGATADGSDRSRDGAVVSLRQLSECLTSADLELYGPGEGPENRLGVTVERAPYRGYVVFADETIADVYVGKDLDAADIAESELHDLYEGFGGDSARFVKRAGNVVVGLDDEKTPSARRLRPLLDCAS